MQKKKTIIICFLLGILFLFSKQMFIKSDTKNRTGIAPSLIPSTVLKPLNSNEKPISTVSRSIFMPYWVQESSNLESIAYKKIYYFGVSADEKGIVKEDRGYEILEHISCPDTKKCILVLRMLDQNISTKILQDTLIQKKIIQQALDLTEAHTFSGIALDLEISGLLSAGVTIQINDFVQQFYTAANKDYKTFSFIVYGDNYYRSRPYDMKFINRYSDEIMIMAYDLSKSYGEPGPNFNFDEKEKYGYDFKTMIRDFKSDVEEKKITVIFGMYGYDWIMNEQGTPLKRGEAVTVNQINKLKSQNSKFPTSSKGFDGRGKSTTQISPLRQDYVGQAKEKKIEYTDNEGQKHVIYYEDEESVAVKTDYLRSEGIGSISFWAHSYF